MMSAKKSTQRVTLSDISKRTGYSLTAVSRALRGMSDIGPEATARIRQAAKELGYVANQTAVALRYGRTNIITVILVNLVNPFFSIMANLIQIAAQEMGYMLVIVCSRNDPALEQQLVEQAIARRSDGVLLFPTRSSAASIETLQAAHIPFVLLCRDFPPYQTDSVVIADQEGSYLATRHLIESGCRRLAFLSVSVDCPSYSLRRAGFLQACNEANIPSEDRLSTSFPMLFDEQSSGPANDQLHQQLLRLRDDGFTGLFMFCDIEAWNIMATIRRSPELHTSDFHIVSFDNIDSALIAPVPLCSVDCGLDSIARQGMELLHSRVNGDDRPLQHIVCPAKLICRGSCGC